MSIYTAFRLPLYFIQKETVLEFHRVFRENGAYPSLHPTLVALTMVLRRDEDLGRINRSHPDRAMHRDYNRSVGFPPDISHLLPPSEDRWWEHLGELQLLRFPHTPAYNPKSRRFSQSARLSKLSPQSSSP